MCKATSLHRLAHTWNSLNNTLNHNAYRGRFAPAPTGNLHFGSLVAALASFCQARSKNGQWLIRIEDLDLPRCIDGASERMLSELQRYGLVSDQPVIYQSHPEQQERYQKALNQLTEEGHCYPCVCNRKTLLQHATYQGTCSQQTFPCDQPHAIRIKTSNQTHTFDDLIQGSQKQNIWQQCGDFIIKRKDKIPAYHLAVVLDDAHQGITQVIRGMDILDSTARQLHLYHSLELQAPQFGHFPVIVDNNKNKLSKQNHAKEIYGEDCYLLTHKALHLLGQEPPDFDHKDQHKLLDWAIKNWDIKNVPARESIQL